jgi:PEP-CTERM motif
LDATNYIDRIMCDRSVLAVLVLNALFTLFSAVGLLYHEVHDRTGLRFGSEELKMFRATLVSVLGLVGSVAVYAGAIEIGGPAGLTNNYITQGAGAVCAAGVGNCVAGNTGGFVEKNYDNVLFSAATNGTAPVPFSGYTQTGGESAGLTDTSNGVANAAKGITFAMISDGGAPINNASKNFWEASSANSTITVPIGVFDVTDVATMLQNVWGTVGGNDTNITFNFGSSSNATSGLTSVTFALQNVNNQTGANAAGEIRASVACITTTTVACTMTTNPSNVPLLTTTLTGSDGHTYGFASDTVFGAASTFDGVYTYNAGAVGMYASTAGVLKMDDQDFNFGSAFANDWLVSVGVTQNAVFGTNVSATALSAITVNSAAATATPEPSTILLVLAGLGSIGAIRRFRRA